jgi:hypothetical protein
MKKLFDSFKKKIKTLKYNNNSKNSGDNISDFYKNFREKKFIETKNKAKKIFLIMEIEEKLGIQRTIAISLLLFLVGVAISLLRYEKNMADKRLNRKINYLFEIFQLHFFMHLKMVYL